MPYLLGICRMKSRGKTIHKAYWQLLAGLALLVMFLVSTIPPRPAPTADSAPALKVVASIAPLHSLAAGVLEGVATPYLLLKSGDTPHHFSLKPRDAEAIAAADVVLSLGLPAEPYLRPLLASLSDKGITHLQASEVNGITLLPQHEEEATEAEQEHHHDTPYDIHLWLSPQNAIALTRQIALTFAERDPAHAPLYKENATRQIAALEALDVETQATFAAREDTTAAYVIYHPVLRYFEHRYGITPAEQAAVASPEAGASAAEAVALEKALAAGQYRCILQETEFSNKLLSSLAARHPEVKALTIDPLGNQFPPSPAQYAQLIRHVSETLAQCLR